jgi:hypothetical protein
MSIALLIGLWVTNGCISTSIQNGKALKDGFVIQKYRFANDESYEFIREWYKDPQCKTKKTTDKEAGKIKIGNAIASAMNSGLTEIDFTHNGKTYPGVFQIKGNELFVGVSLDETSRPAFPGMFAYNHK